MFDLCLRKTRAGKSRDYRDVTISEKLSFQKCFQQTRTKKAMKCVAVDSFLYHLEMSDFREFFIHKGVYLPNFYHLQTTTISKHFHDIFNFT